MPDPSLAEEFPGLEALLLEVRGVRVEPESPSLSAYAKDRLAGYAKTYALETLKDEPRLRAYRDFLWRVGIDPTKVRPAAEALLRRAVAGRPFPRINSLVDAYNLASMETRIAVAAFDLSKIHGKLRMRRARPGEPFLGIGIDAPASLTGSEVVVEDADTLLAIYPYRDSEASKVTTDTRDALFLICGVPGIPSETLREAAHVTANLVTKFCGGVAGAVR